jgi:HlyD family secretion protein
MSSDNFFENILKNMADGVMALDFKGRIIMFNTAAGNILGMDPARVTDKTFAGVFMSGGQSNDDFSQAVLDAVYEQGIGLASTVGFIREDGSEVFLSMTSSYLRGEAPGGDNRGVILVFSDITQLRRMQARQEEDARKLGRAYQDLEEKTALLQQVMKRSRIVRFVSTILIVGLFLGLGLYYFQGDALLNRIRQAGPETRPGTDEAVERYFTVEQRPLSSSVSLSGRLEPLEEIVVTAPFEAMIEERHFSFGQMVEKGDLLILLDSSDLEIKLRNAVSEFIKAGQRYRELLSWDSGTEMTRARRSLARARDTLEMNQRELEESELLFEQGIVPANEVEGKRRSVDNALVDVEAALEELESVREKGSRENIELVEMELENARVNLSNLEKQMAGREVRAPVSGVVIKPVSEDDKKISLERGTRVSAGTSLFAVGDLSGVTVSTRVDEVDVRNISLGQPVSARGDAFPDIQLEGMVSHISAQAVTTGSQQAASFDVLVTFPGLDEQSLDVIRVGMSADLEVLVYDKDDALMVPISSVRVVQGRPMVRLVEPDGRITEKEVVTGLTTLGSVEIRSGLEPGDRLSGW